MKGFEYYKYIFILSFMMIYDPDHCVCDHTHLWSNFYVNLISEYKQLLKENTKPFCSERKM